MDELKSIVKQYRTPMYFYDTSIIDRQWNILQSHKPANLDIYYAMKGNSNLSILQYFRTLGLGVEIASGGELFLANKAEFSGEQILFTGPSKSNQELEDAVQKQIKTIHIESLHEAQRLNEICNKLGRKQAILVRINAKYEVKTKIQLSGCSSPFGISEEDIYEVLPEILKLPNLDFMGIHVYNASGILDFEMLIQNVKNVFKLVQDLESKLAIYIPIIDFGGGLGIDYSPKNNHVDIPSFYSALKEQISLFAFEERTLIMEIARFLVADCGIYITEVLDKKVSRGQTFIITDGGIQHFMRTSLFGDNHAVDVIQNDPTNLMEVVNITGSLCTNIDVLANDIELPIVKIGDWVIIEKAGCYGLNASINHFLSHEMPVELMKDENGIRVIRSRGEHKDLLLNQVNYD